MLIYWAIVSNDKFDLSFFYFVFQIVGLNCKFIFKFSLHFDRKDILLYRGYYWVVISSPEPKAQR